MTNRILHAAAIASAMLLLCGCGMRDAPPEQPQAAPLPDWETALCGAIAEAAPTAAASLPPEGAGSLRQGIPAWLSAQSGAEYLRAVTWEQQETAAGSLLHFQLEYDAAPCEIAAQRAALAGFAARWAAGCRTLPEEVRALLAHDAVIRMCRYDAAASGTAYAALLCGKASCGGYAAAFRTLCEAAGIPCTVLCGTAHRSGSAARPHAWNLVTLGGSRYHVDCTWDDRDAGTPLHTFFLCSDAEMASTHAWDRQQAPAAEGGALSYGAIVAAMRAAK